MEVYWKWVEVLEVGKRFEAEWSFLLGGDRWRWVESFRA